MSNPCSCSCCTALMERCAADGTTVAVLLDASTQTSSYYNTDGSPWTGDPATLVKCGGGTGPVAMFFEYVIGDPATHVPGTIVGTGTDTDPYQIPIFAADATGDCCPTDLAFDPATGLLTLTYVDADGAEQTLVTPIPFPDLVVTTDGDANGVTITGHTVDIVITDPDPSNIATVGPNGGTLVTCDDINGCLNFVYVPFDPAVHDGGVIEGAGTVADPYQIPMPLETVEITDISITNTTVNADGSTTVTYTVTETDDGDPDPATHSFDVVFPSAAQVFIEYVAYDPAIHDGGVVEGAGTAASPYQVPLPPDLCAMLSGLPAATGEAAIGDEFLVLQLDGTCARKSLPASAAPPDLLVTTDGTAAGVAQSGTGDHIVDITVTSTDVGNIATVGPDGGTLVTCDDVKDCFNFEYVAYDPAVHDGGIIEGDGTAANPFQVPLPPDTVEITDIAITNTTVNADGSTTVTYTVTETDDGDPDPATHSFDVVFPAGADINFAYVAYDPLVHTDGVVQGSGTTADPYQIPLPADPCCDSTEVYHEGDTAAVDLVLPDGTVLTAGSPVPAGVVIVADYDIDGNLIRENSFTVGSDVCDTVSALPQAGEVPTDGSVQLMGVDPVNGCQLYDPKTCTFVYVPFDPAIHDAGVLEGAGTTADPFQIPLPGDTDVCAALAALPAGDCASLPADLVTANCETVSTDDIVPGHTFGQCVSTPELLDPEATGGPAPTELSATLVDTGQLGSTIAGLFTTDPPYQHMQPGDTPLTVPVPATNPDCVLFLQVSYGADWLINGLTIAHAGTEYAAPVTVDIETSWDAGIDQHIYAFDANTAGAGDTVEFTFATAPDGTQTGVFQWNWIEVCEPTGLPLSLADFDLGNLFRASSPGGAADGDVQTSTEFDAGACPALVIGSARHVADVSDSGCHNCDTDWFASPIVDEIYDKTSLDYFNQCQLGTVAGTIVANAGPSTYTYTPNNEQVNKTQVGGIVGIPLSCAGLSAGVVAESAACAVDLVNDNCQDGVMQCHVVASVRVCNGPGETTNVVPVINGAEYPSQAISWELEGCHTIPLSFPITDLANPVPQGGTGSISVTLKASGAGTAQLSEWSTTCELVHV